MMTNSKTPASRAARARCATRHNAAKLAAGYQRLNILISPAAAAALDLLVAEHGTKTAAIEAALLSTEKHSGTSRGTSRKTGCGVNHATR